MNDFVYFKKEKNSIAKKRYFNFAGEQSLFIVFNIFAIL